VVKVRVENKKRRKILLIALLLIAVTSVSGIARVYIYRQADINVRVNDYTQATGSALFGFYQGGNDNLIDLYAPNGTRTYGTNKVYVYFHGLTAISDDGTTQVKMYSTATVETNITQGGWVFESLINFGLDKYSGGNSLILKVKTPSQASQAELKVYREVYYVSTGNLETAYIGTLDLTDPDSQLNCGGIGWSPGTLIVAYTSDLIVTYDQPINDTFSVSIYGTT